MIGPADTFHIAFDTESMPGWIVMTTVRIRKEILICPGAFDARRLRLDLCDHPLYPALRRYVLDNPDSQIDD
jgi:hypothetical protein